MDRGKARTLRANPLIVTSRALLRPSFPRRDGGDQRLDAFDFGLGKDAMPQVEDMARGATHGLQQSHSLASDDGGRGVEEHGVEIALHRDIGGQRAADDGKVVGPIHAQHRGASERLVK